jgi:hypothetical protein
MVIADRDLQMVVLLPEHNAASRFAVTVQEEGTLSNTEVLAAGSFVRHYGVVKVLPDKETRFAVDSRPYH